VYIGRNFDLRNEKLLDGRRVYAGFSYGFTFETRRVFLFSLPLGVEIAYGKGVSVASLGVQTLALTLRYGVD
jgi:hypothetical protein